MWNLKQCDPRPDGGRDGYAYRILCREQGAGLVCMEMVSAKAILYKNKNTQELLKVDERERPVSLQLFGSDPDIVADIAASLEDGPYDIFDINMGCPVPKIVKNGEALPYEKSEAGGGNPHETRESGEKAGDCEIPQGL